MYKLDKIGFSHFLFQQEVKLMKPPKMMLKRKAIEQNVMLGNLLKTKGVSFVVLAFTLWNCMNDKIQFPTKNLVKIC